MRITRIVIPDFQQFRDFDLSFTDPSTGKPLDRVCFIGRNGTGKTTLLRVIYDLLGRVANRPPQFPHTMDVYRGIIHNTNFYTATHSPIIAAQFRPEERVIQDFDDTAHVIAHRGVTPIGDDPNDLLNKDFEVRSLYGKEGIQKWERFLQLRREIPTVTDPQQKQDLLQE